jgi:hypothetical protein
MPVLNPKTRVFYEAIVKGRNQTQDAINADFSISPTDSLPQTRPRSPGWSTSGTSEQATATAESGCKELTCQS